LAGQIAELLILTIDRLLIVVAMDCEHHFVRIALFTFKLMMEKDCSGHITIISRASSDKRGNSRAFLRGTITS
jgi:hypothetical protein